MFLLWMDFFVFWQFPSLFSVLKCMDLHFYHALSLFDYHSIFFSPFIFLLEFTIVNPQRQVDFCHLSCADDVSFSFSLSLSVFSFKKKKFMTCFHVYFFFYLFVRYAWWLPLSWFFHLWAFFKNLLHFFIFFLSSYQERMILDRIETHARWAWVVTDTVIRLVRQCQIPDALVLLTFAIEMQVALCLWLFCCCCCSCYYYYFCCCCIWMTIFGEEVFVEFEFEREMLDCWLLASDLCQDCGIYLLQFCSNLSCCLWFWSWIFS